MNGIYSDFRKHDLGPRFHELGFDGAAIRAFRTPPLWGVGSSAPYGHDGRSLSLEDVIERHGGEAQPVVDKYGALSENAREDVLAFLRSLVLYEVHGMPADVDEDGRITEAWQVTGRPTGGPERFDPELICAVPCAIEGPTTGYDGPIFSRACTNVERLYRTNLRARRDRDRDGFPDLLDACETTFGLLDGCSDAPWTGP